MQSARSCPSCATPIPDGQRFCGSCGVDTRVGDAAPTRTFVGGSAMPGRTPSSSSGGGRGIQSDTTSGGRFLPGAIFGGRYRIVGLVGRGGMGEVYRADDLKLGQPVALKFLNPSLDRDPDRLRRFLNEVRVARQIAHPNVCRVYDVGDVDGVHYLSMEYIDGEDLATLLRRIGRLPEDKAVQVARQLCAGLAAAHDQGILHRDLKPANVMIDGRGVVRITDFGLAGLAEEFHGAEVRAGTPSYMAPEQLSGEGVTIRSDIYALGLLLYELFTGKRAFTGNTLAEISRLQQDVTLTRPTTVIAGLDGAVERTILECLQPDPDRRPASALAVAAALPGGDPLAAALAAGETPSPELVAAAGRAEALRPWWALGIATLAVVLFIVAAGWNGRQSLRAFLPMDKPPQVLVDRAQEVVRELGYDESYHQDPVDEAYGYNIWTLKLARLQTERGGADRWEPLADPKSGVLSFWYRQSPVKLFPNPSERSFVPGRVARWDPFPSVTGGLLVSLSPEGELRFFAATPRRFSTDEGEEEVDDAEPDWAAFFELAGLDIANFRSVEPRYQRYMHPDRRAAWVGKLPGSDEETRIELATVEGRLVLFATLDGWELDRLVSEPEILMSQPSILQVAMQIFILLVIGAAFGLGRHNLRRGSADRPGAMRIAAVVFATVVVLEVLRCHPLWSLKGIDLVFPILATGIFYAVVLFMFYLALEPYARRHWPSMLVSWSRLLGRGRYGLRDPLLGRSVLAGLVAGAALVVMMPLQYVFESRLDGAPALPRFGNWFQLLRPRDGLAEVIDAILDGTLDAVLLTFLVVASRIVLRRRAAALVVAFVVWLMMAGGLRTDVGETLRVLPSIATVAVVLLVVLIRFGLVGLLVASIVNSLQPLAAVADWSAWHARPAWLVLGFFAVLALYAFWAASSGRSLFGEADDAASPG